MATGFSIKDTLNSASKAEFDDSKPRARFRTKDISIFKMYRNELNFYSMSEIEELAGDILMYGLKQNLEVCYAPTDAGEYRIIAGERRWEALKLLVSRGHKEFEVATAKMTSPQNPDEEQVEIIIANAYRAKSTSDLIEEEKRLKESLGRMKADGRKIKGYDLTSGRLRDVIASILKISKTKVAQIEVVEKNLIPEWKEELKAERLTFSAAYELGGMPEADQRAAWEKHAEDGLSLKDVKAMKEDPEKAAVGSVSHSDTFAMNPSEEEEEARPEVMISKCYSCLHYAECDAKSSFVTACGKYSDKAEAEKTPEQRYDEEQAVIDRATKKKLEEMAEKDPKRPAEVVSEEKEIRMGPDAFRRITTGAKSYILARDRGYHEGEIVALVEYESGKRTGRAARMKIRNLDNNETTGCLTDGSCVLEFESILKFESMEGETKE